MNKNEDVCENLRKSRSSIDVWPLLAFAVVFEALPVTSSGSRMSAFYALSCKF